jgi:hypothetical protein
LNNPEKRIEGFDIAKTLAILLLFFVHSNLNQTQPLLTQGIQYFFLGIFFYASGYFSASSLKKRGRFRLLARSTLTVFVPYIVFAAFYLIIEYPRYTSNFPAFATGLNIYAPFGIKSYNLWFIPAFMICYLISALCFDIPFILGIGVLGIFIFQATVTNFLHWLLPIFLVVYLFGYFHNRVRLRDYLTIAILAFTLFFIPLYISSAEGSNLQAMSGWTLYTLSSVVPFMYLMSKVHLKIPSVRKISESTLYIYLAEPAVTSFLAIAVSGTL